MECYREERSSTTSETPYPPPHECIGSSSSTSTTHQVHAQAHQQEGITMQKRKAGRKKFQETRHPVYKGVRRRKGKWVSELREPYKKSRIWLGTFSSPDMAAKAYDAATFALKGESASLNFPEAAYALPHARSTSIRDIQSAAMEAAEAFGDHDAKTSTPSPLELSFSSSDEAQENSSKLFLDEEEVFNLPGILNGMAEGLILTPPAMQKGFNWDDHVDGDAVDLTLWSD